MRDKTRQDGKVSKVEARHGQDRARQNSSLQDGIYALEKDETTRDRKEQDRIGQTNTRWDKTRQDKIGRDKSRQDSSLNNNNNNNNNNNVHLLCAHHALSAHMIHINLNMIFYTHVERSPTKTIYIKYYTKQQQQQQQQQQQHEQNKNKTIK